ncbi:putative sulfate exporter family transporter [Agrococcus sp. ARC_14]|uniref:YeiH family protein n=1 Tax=Agrococcus sp. ARC_14 TaxID=2919927 RepID=UPI001F06E486|nr:putative sulfate exporter family transporter [Agrococcus sp. ARC_14]MCH1883920.1 putative sulfate exporter family transporter [Agrococcus sp. ARC_14]
MTDGRTGVVPEGRTPRAPGRTARVAPGLLVAGAAALIAWGLHAALPAVPLLTAAVVLGIVVAQLPVAQPALSGRLKPGLGLAAKRCMRIGIVLLGLQLSLLDIAALGWVAIAAVVGVLLVTFVATLALGRLLRLPGHQPLLIAAGFSICGASAIGAMSHATGSDDEEAATPVALVTLCGTLAIVVLPLLWHPLGLSALEFGHWVGASVHDVGQVVATAQIAGPAALAVAVVVKLTRVVMLAPMVAVTTLVMRRRGDASATGASRPPIVPLFVAGFIAAMLLRSFTPVPEAVLEIAAAVQTALLAMALFGLGAAVRIRSLVRTGWRALLVALLSWVLVAGLAWGAVQLG